MLGLGGMQWRRNVRKILNSVWQILLYPVAAVLVIWATMAALAFMFGIMWVTVWVLIQIFSYV